MANLLWFRQNKPELKWGSIQQLTKTVHDLMYLVLEAYWSGFWIRFHNHSDSNPILFHGNILHYYIYDLFLTLHVFHHECSRI